MKKYLTTRAAAEALGVDPRTLARAVERGELKPDSIHVSLSGEPSSAGFFATTVREWKRKHYREEFKRG